MQKISVVIVAVGILCSLFFVKADAVSNSAEVKKEHQVAGYAQKINALYQQIDFGNEAPLARDVFEQAYRGYLNLKAAGKVHSDQEILSICDFSLSANSKRLWVIDLKAGKVLYHSLVAHGQGTGDEFARHFSNREGSHQSSLGFYITEDTYTGNNGYSLKLQGMDPQYNDLAYERAIVMHGADYVCPDFISNHKRLGRSWGCPAVPVALARPIINTIKGGNCLYIYYPDTQYLASSKWLDRQPEIPDADFLALPSLVKDSSQATAKQARVLADASSDRQNELNDIPQQEDQKTLYQGVHLGTGNPVE